MNAQLDFGDISEIKNQFHFFLESEETIWDIAIQYYCRITDDNFIQFSISVDKSEQEITAQYKLRFISLKENLIFIIQKYIEANLLYHA